MQMNCRSGRANPAMVEERRNHGNDRAIVDLDERYFPDCETSPPANGADALPGGGSLLHVTCAMRAMRVVA
jgi:hypothetical protein